MACNQVIEALQAACSPSSEIRMAAESHLKYLLQSNMNSLFHQLFNLLRSLNPNIQTMAFSYLLSIVRTRRANKFFNNFLSEVENAYTYFEMLVEEEVTFGRDRFRLHKSNIIRLASAYYSDQLYNKEREELIFRVSLILSNSEHLNLIHFYNNLLHSIAEQVAPSILMRAGIRIHDRLHAFLQQFWNSGTQTTLKRQMAVGASYYYSLAASPFYKLISSHIIPTTPPILLRKIIKRFSYLYSIEARLPLDLNVQVFLSGLQLALGLRIERMDEDKLEELTMMLMGSLKAIVTDDRDVAGAIIIQQVLSLSVYQQVVEWLFRLVHHLNISNDHSEINITAMAISIIQMFNDHLSEEIIEQFFVNFVPSSEEAMLSLLCGANFRVMNHFDHAEVTQRIVKRNKVIPQEKNIIYFMFMLKSLKYTKIISYEDYQNTGNFLLLQLNAIKQTYAYNQHRHVLSLSYLYLCLVQLCTYPYQFAKIGLPQQLIRILIRTCELDDTVANDNIIEAIRSLFSFIDFKREIFNISYQTLSNNFNNLTKGHLQWQTQVLSIMRQTLTSQDMQRSQIVSFLIDLSKVAEQCNPVMGKEIVHLLGDSFRYYNDLLYANRNNQSQRNPALKLDFVDVSSLTNILNELLFSQSFNDIFELFDSKTEDLMISSIQAMVSNFQQSIKLLLELSLHTQYHPFIDFLLANMLEMIENSSNFYIQLQKKIRISSNKTIPKLELMNKIPKYVKCLAQFVYINPAWRHTNIISDDKKRLANLQIFNLYAQGLHELAKKDLALMMERVSLSDSEPTLTKWSGEYSELLVKSSIEKIFHIWLRQSKE